MSQYLKNASVLAQKALVLTDEQKKTIKSLEKQMGAAQQSIDFAIELIDRDLKAKKLTEAQAECEAAIAKAEGKAQIQSLEAKVREINPAWTSNVKEQAAVLAQNTAVKGLELIGAGLGFLGRAINTAKSSAKGVTSQGNFSSIETPKVIDQLEKLSG